jgi:uncharacterized membrane protein
MSAESSPPEQLHPRLHPLIWITSISTGILFACSSTRHLLFQSTAYDLGYFDQALWLLSQGLPPVVSFWGYHFLGGHGDLILYPISLLYRIYPSVYWLFAIQAIALSLGAVPTWHLAQQAGLKQRQVMAIAIAYLLYPLIFNLNLFDFHPEVIALPTMLAAVWAARSGRIGGFCAAIVLILSCRDALSLTVAAMGFWLLVLEKRRVCGAIALVSGTAWFVIVTQVLIPQFRPTGVESVYRYAYLGNSLPEILQNLVLKPQLVLNHLFADDNLFYLLLVFLPVAWGLSVRHLGPLVVAIPTLAINCLSMMSTQKDLIHQYSLPIVPFLMVATIAALAAGRGLVRNPRGILIWALIGFLALSKYDYFGDRYLKSIDNWSATREAIAQVHTQGSVLTTAQLTPHLTHRPVVQLAVGGIKIPSLVEFKYVLLNQRHPGWGSSPEFVSSLLQQIRKAPQFELTYQRDQVFLFTRKGA